MPLDLRYQPAGFLPALCLIVEARVVAAHFLLRSPDRALEQVSDPLLPDPVGRQPDRSLSRPGNFAALADLPGEWIDQAHQRRPSPDDRVAGTLGLVSGWAKAVSPRK
jgi:hypothetical protein